MNLVCGPHTLDFGERPLVMGVLNVTPDSFFDGGRHDAVEAAVEHARRMAAEGADLIDVGAESTRPGAEPVGLDDELARLLPVIEGVRRLDLGVPLSVDTAKPEAADRALAAGAHLINDISGAGDAMLEVAARHGAPAIAMHMQGEPRTMQREPRYDDVVAEVRGFLAERVAAGRRLGVDVLTDPGIGFGKTLEHNLDLLANLHELRRIGAPVVLGVSRKSFLDRLLGGVPVEERLAGTLAVNAWAAATAAADVLRVHDVEPHRHLAESIGALRRRRDRSAPGRRVLARGIVCRSRIGVTREERAAPQELLVDIEATLAPRGRGARDGLAGLTDHRNRGNRDDRADCNHRDDRDGPADCNDAADGNDRDGLAETVDYAELAAIARAVAARREYRLVETLAEGVAAAVAAEGAPTGSPANPSRIESLRVRVTKPGAARELDAASVGAEVHWRP